MNIAVISFKNQDVSESMEELLQRYAGQNPTLLLPVMKPLETFTQSVLKTAIETKTKITCFFESAVGLDHILKQADDISLTENPIGSVIHHLKPGDALAIVWDDSPQAHVIVHGVEDLALDTWDLSDGLEELEVEDGDFSLDGDDIREEMIAAMGKFVDLLAAFVANLVMSSLSEAVAEHIMLSEEDGDTKDIDPFNNL
jgi:hypothetical protein